jgi:serine/threonine protein kinase
MISDFGSSKVVGYEGDGKFSSAQSINYFLFSENFKGQMKPVKQRSTFVGTAQYISPEVAGGRSCGPEADFWALGGIIFQMISGQPPFRGVSEYKILQKINKLQYCFPQGFDETAKDLVKRLLVTEVEERLGHSGIDEIKEHPFFKVNLKFCTKPNNSF